jgi:hypothetical protein
MCDAGGVWSRTLVRGLGLKVCLETERGYNTTYPKSPIDLPMPVFFSDHGFIASPLAVGLRVGGAVEMASPDAPPNYKRAAAMRKVMRRYVPDLPEEGGVEWMGCRPSTPDSMPVIGRDPRDPRIVFAFGHGHPRLSAATARHVARQSPAGPTKAGLFGIGAPVVSIRAIVRPATTSHIRPCARPSSASTPATAIGPNVAAAARRCRINHEREAQDFSPAMRIRTGLMFEPPHDLMSDHPPQLIRETPTARCSSSRPAAACRCAAMARSAPSRSSSRGAGDAEARRQACSGRRPTVRPAFRDNFGNVTVSSEHRPSPTGLGSWSMFDPA